MRYSVGSGLAPKCPFRSIRTCCATAAATPLANAGHDTRALLGPLDVAQPPQLLAERFERIGECVRIFPEETDTMHLPGLLRPRQ